MRLAEQAAEYLMLLNLGLLSPADIDGVWAMRVMHYHIGLGRRKPTKKADKHSREDPRERIRAAKRKKAELAKRKRQHQH
jgi:hypothetical protein